MMVSKQLALLATVEHPHPRILRFISFHFISFIRLSVRTKFKKTSPELLEWQLFCFMDMCSEVGIEMHCVHPHGNNVSSLFPSNPCTSHTVIISPLFVLLITTYALQALEKIGQQGHQVSHPPKTLILYI